MEVSVSKIKSNEELLNAALSDYSEQLTREGQRKGQLRKEIETESSQVRELNQELENLQNRSTRARNKIEEITNTSSKDGLLAQMRRRAEDLRAEIKQKDVRIGVLGSVLLSRQSGNARVQALPVFPGDSAVFQPDDLQMEELL